MNRFGLITTAMIKEKLLLFTLAIITSLTACHFTDNANEEAITTDSAVVANGEVLFTKNCSGCHNFFQDAIGPQLSGLTTEVSKKWLAGFISDPQKTINSGDARAVGLYKKYRVTMPSFSLLGDSAINAVIAFLNTHKQRAIISKDNNGTALKNPVPDSIQSSKLVVQLQQLTQFPASIDSGKKPLARITKLTYMPGTNNLFVLDLRGKLYSLQQNKPMLYMDMAALMQNFINEPGLATGFGSFAFHPDFLKNGLLYTAHAEKANSAKGRFWLCRFY